MSSSMRGMPEVIGAWAIGDPAMARTGDGQEPKGGVAAYLWLLALCVGTAVGVGLGAAVGSVGGGVAIGTGVGVAVGFVLYRWSAKRSTDD